MKSVTVEQLKQLMDANADFQLIDVREDYEYEESNIGGLHIPMAEIPAHVNKVAKDKQVVIHCRSGKRSANMILFLEQQGFDNLYNLEGGIKAWAERLDPAMTVG